MKPTQTTRVPNGSGVYARLMEAVTTHVPVGVAIDILNKALLEAGLTPEGLRAENATEVIGLMMPSIERVCPKSAYAELLLDLSTAGFTAPPRRGSDRP